MLRVKDYLRTGQIERLCVDIAMPQEVTRGILAAIGTCDYSGVDELFSALFDPAAGEEPALAIKEKYRGERQDSLDNLALYLAAALHTREMYLEKGIPLDIFTATTAQLVRFMGEHYVSYGVYGFDRDFWVNRFLSMRLFRLGQLEHEMYTCRDDGRIGEYAKKGDAAISVHIPSDAVMTRAALEETYAWAQRFFAQYYPDFSYKLAFCDSWLLSPVLKELLPPTSRILEFQSDYKIVRVKEGSAEEVNRWIFKRRYQDVNELPEDTSLQRAAKALLLRGGSIGSAAGVLKGRFGLAP